MDIDSDRKVYLFIHGRADLRDKAVSALKSAGVSEGAIVDAVSEETGQVGDYMAMLWMPPNPDHIKMQRITAVAPVEPEGMMGLWKGVSADDLGKVDL